MKFKDFLGKVGDVVKDKGANIAGIAISAATGNISGALAEVSDLLKGEDSPEAKALLNELEIRRMDFQREMFALEVDDRKDARKNTADKHLKIVVAYFSLIGFTVFSVVNSWLAYQILVNKWEVNEFIIMWSAETHGIFTALLFTLKDYLFGGKSNDTN